MTQINNKVQNFEQELLKTITPFAVFATIFYTTLHIIVGRNTIVIILDIALCITYSIIYYFSAFKNITQYLIIIFCIILLGIYSIFFNFLIGMVGGGINNFVVTVFAFTLLFKNKVRYYFIWITSIIYLILVFNQIIYFDFFIDKIQITRINYAIFAITDFAVFVFIAYMAKSKYEFIHTQLMEKNKEIAIKNTLLQQQSEEIKTMNEHLEELVHLKTQELEEQNKQLIDYAYFNAHKVRGPLARILGLIYIYHQETDKENMDFYINQIAVSAKELDEIVREINEILAEDKEDT